MHEIDSWANVTLESHKHWPPMNNDVSAVFL